MHFKIVTIFPKELSNSLSYGVVGNAINDNTIRIDYFDPRDHSDNKYGSIDDKPWRRSGYGYAGKARFRIN